MRFSGNQSRIVVRGVGMLVAGMLFVSATACCRTTHVTTSLGLNAPNSMTLDAGRYWNDSGIDITAGGTYEFSISNQSVWFDASIASSAAGYSCPWLLPFTPFRRTMTAPWFALICTVDHNDSFVVFSQSPCFEYSEIKGSQSVQTCRQEHTFDERSGRLFCYANDIPFMTFNNSGTLTVTVKMK